MVLLLLTSLTWTMMEAGLCFACSFADVGHIIRGSPLSVQQCVWRRGPKAKQTALAQESDARWRKEDGCYRYATHLFVATHLFCRDRPAADVAGIFGGTR